MRDLFKVISWLKAKTEMEYCELFDGIKSILEFSNKYIKPFDKFYFKAGHESIIEDIVKRLQHLFKEYEVFSDDEAMQKVVIFLTLNSNVSFKHNLKDNPYLGHVVEVCPLMPTFLLIDIIWSLRLDKQFYELLTYTPCWFSFQFFEPATESLKYVSNPYDVLEKVEQLLKAIIFSIASTQQGEIDIVNIKVLTNKLCDYSMNLMRQFYTPDAIKFERFTKRQHYKYDGYALKHLLHLISHAFDIYEENIDSMDTKLADKLKIYSIFQKFVSTSRVSSSTVTSKVIETLKEQQLKIIIALLNALQNNVMLVNVDKYLHWAELEEKNIGTRNLQEEIGHLIYNVAERIKQNSNFSHDVINQLGALAIRPLPLQEIIENSTIGDILNAIEGSESTSVETKALWLNELINRKMALGNEECLQTIKENISLITDQHCLKILNFIKLEIERYYLETYEKEYNPEVSVDLEEVGICSELISVLLMALQYLKEGEIIAIIQKQIELFGRKVNIFMQPQLEQRIVELLNQSNGVEKEFSYKNFLILVMENPQLCWSKFYKSACTNQKHIVLYCTVVHRFLPISEQYFLSLLEETFTIKDDINQLYFPQLLSEMYFQLYADGKKTDFLKGIIHKHVNTYLDANEYQLLLPIMKAMNIMVSHGESQSHKLLNFGELTAPVLLMVAQIMDKARWDLITYSHSRDELVRECIHFVQQTSKRFLPNANAKDRKWISSVVTETCKPITQFYFQKYLLTLSQEPLKFHRFLMGEDTEDESKIQTFLIANYLRCTSKEVEWLANCKKLLPHIYDSLCILRAVVKSSNNENAIDNYHHCLIMYMNIAQKYILPNIADSNDEIISLEIKLLKLIATSSEEIYEKTFEIFEPLLFNILRLYKGPMDSKVVYKLQQILSKIPDCDIKTVFLEKMENILNISDPADNSF